MTMTGTPTAGAVKGLTTMPSTELIDPGRVVENDCQQRPVADEVDTVATLHAIGNAPVLTGIGNTTGDWPNDLDQVTDHVPDPTVDVDVACTTVGLVASRGV